ncbi:MAG TPA: hypothetical protein V6D05_04345, partial [Stenomitos sp.]
MGGIDNIQAGNIPMNAYKASALDAPGSAANAPVTAQGTGAVGDANQTRGGQAVLKAAAADDGGVTAYIGADLTFQDKTPN